MTSPKISILLPNLNTKKFLNERIDSILAQTELGWELIIVDSFSNDGSWERIIEYANMDKRICAFQMPQEGIYAGINHCLKKAQGKYIYIATGDDTMEPDCLEKMSDMLDKYPNCGFCHCNLKMIDENGNWLKGRWEHLLTQKFYKDLLYKVHVRKAPLDGFLHFVLGTIFTSLTQLLIRKKVFDLTGAFQNQWGSIGDYDWGIKASTFFDSVHIPEYLATWRIHEGQATPQKTNKEIFKKQIEIGLCSSDFIKKFDVSLHNTINKNWKDLSKLTEYFNLYLYSPFNVFKILKHFFSLDLLLYCLFYNEIPKILFKKERKEIIFAKFIIHKILGRKNNYIEIL